MHKLIRIQIVLLTLLLASCATTPQPSVAERLSELQRSDADRERDTSEQPAQVLTFLGIESSMRVADLFAGGGYYSELLSHVVGEQGRVIAYNNGAYDRFSAEQTKARFGGNRLANTDYLLAEVPDVQFPTDLDAAIMVMSFHDLYWVDEAQGWPDIDERAFLRNVFKSLKPGGILGVIDHHAVDGSGVTAVPALHRIDRAFAIAELTAVGFRLSDESDLLRNTADDRTTLVFDPSIRRKTDRFVLKFTKP